MPYTESLDTQLGSANPAPGGATAALATQLPDVCALQRRTRAADGAGGTTDTWATIAHADWLLERALRFGEGERADRITGVTVWRARFPVGTDLQPEDRVLPCGVFRVATRGATAGTFTLTFNGQTTAGIAWNAAPAAVQSALVALSTIGADDVLVIGAAGGPWEVRFREALLNTQLVLTGSGAGLTGGAFRIDRPAYEVLDTDAGVSSPLFVMAHLTRLRLP